MRRRRLVFVLGLVGVLASVAAACGGGYAEEKDDKPAPDADAGAGADTFVAEAAAPPGVDVVNDTATEPSGNEASVDARPPSFCTNRVATLCEDFESAPGVPTGWTTPEPIFDGKLSLVEGEGSPHALRVDPTTLMFDAGLPSGGPSIKRVVPVTVVPASIDVSFKFRIGTVRQGGRLVEVDTGRGQGFHLYVYDGTQGFQLFVILDTREGPKTVDAYLIYGGWHTGRFTLNAAGAHHIEIDGQDKSSGDLGYYDTLGANDMSFRFGAWSEGSHPTPSTLASIEYDDILVVSNKP